MMQLEIGDMHVGQEPVACKLLHNRQRVAVELQSRYS